MATALLDAPPTTAVPICRDGESLYEIIDGELKESEPMGAYMTLLAFALAARLNEFVNRHKLGVVITEMLFKFQHDPDRGRRPDVAFVSRERCRQSPLPKEGDWDVVPDLAVEVVSPTNDATELEEKLVEYFRFGVRQVWVLHPEHRRLYVHESLRKVSVLNEDDSIPGGDLFPGLSLPLAELFAAVALAE